MTQDELKLVFDALKQCNAYAFAGGLGLRATAHRDALAILDKALAQPEPVAWRTFDGEGGYDYRSYEDNESYADDWNKRNPNHAGWVDKLYTASPQRKPLTEDEAISAVSSVLPVPSTARANTPLANRIQVRIGNCPSR